MENEQNFLDQMENLKVPDVDTTPHQQKIKITIMNAERSAALGVWLIAVPCFFLFCVIMYYAFHIKSSWFGAMYKLVTGLSKNPYIDFLAPVVLLILPMITIIINTLAITHVHYEKRTISQLKYSELNITVKIKWLNILLILISLTILLILLSFAMTENISIQN
ncbi:MAG: hypothetical protein ABI367_02015 [Mucilaginibacter sp.]